MDKNETELETSYRRGDKDPKRGGPPPTLLASVHMVEDRIPLCGLHIGSIVLVQAVVRPTVVAAYLE